MTSAQLDGLFAPFSASSLRLRNRFAMAPMTRMKSPGGIPNEENVEYYRKRAAGGVGLIITEGTYVNAPAAGPSSAVPRFYGDASAAGWAKVAEAVHSEGGAIIPQLWHTGVARGTDVEFEPDLASVSPSGIDLAGEPLGAELTTADIDRVIAGFAESAALAKKIGFDGVEIHGAHGYLLDQFFWERTNRRTDGYGGDLRRRSSLPAEVVAAVRDAVGADFAIVYRFSQWKGGHYDARIAETPADLESILAPLVTAGVDVFHPSTRRHWVPGFETSASDPTGLAGWTKKVTGLPAITVGSVGVDSVFLSEDQAIPESTYDRLDILRNQFERGEFDVVALGRALLADAAWVDKIQSGRLDDIVPFRKAA
ncbi:NADH:flavin oxidoreductase [Antrihabitans cavernicola]|uniref:NADH:flavin oxidoreductase n=1 Tax=Antrihabitans cavernicola TaxID=2495913 RepID=A0A5A7SEK9_9NOCA|nr:NADH:flavin oxidoreductase [Spelaeibacter cavernicola]KAA0024024.1 NADH:flavin oxidoreductase [Spelaeibacter cavernicola]